MKYFFFITTFIFTNYIFGATIDIAKVEIPQNLQEKLDPLSYKIDAYGNIRIHLRSLDEIKMLKSLKEKAEVHFKGRGIYVHIPPKKNEHYRKTRGKRLQSICA